MTYKTICLMCDKPIIKNKYGEWVHAKDYSTHCYKKSFHSYTHREGPIKK